MTESQKKSLQNLIDITEDLYLYAVDCGWCGDFDKLDVGSSIENVRNIVNGKDERVLLDRDGLKAVLINDNRILLTQKKTCEFIEDIILTRAFTEQEIEEQLRRMRIKYLIPVYYAIKD